MGWYIRVASRAATSYEDLSSLYFIVRHTINNLLLTDLSSLTTAHCGIQKDCFLFKRNDIAIYQSQHGSNIGSNNDVGQQRNSKGIPESRDSRIIRWTHHNPLRTSGVPNSCCLCYYLKGMSNNDLVIINRKITCGYMRNYYMACSIEMQRNNGPS